MSTSDGEQRFSLRWNDYQPALASAFESLRINEDFVDVTLGCEGKRLPSHRMLLSACSPYFRDLLKSNPCQHPIIILRETKYEDLKCILEFMYQGEVSVEQSKLDSFLRTAESLRIRGLTEENEDVIDQKPDISGTQNNLGQMVEVSMKQETNTTTAHNLMGREMSRLSRLPAEPGTSGRKRQKLDKNLNSAYSAVHESNDGEPVYKSEKMEEVINLDDEQEQDLLTGGMVGGEEEYGADESEIYDEGFDNLAENASFPGEVEDGSGPDLHHCGVKFRDIDSWMLHIRQCHPGAIICNHCPKMFKHRSNLSRHMAVHYGRSKCTICQQTLSDIPGLRRHLRCVHNIDASSISNMPSIP